MKRVTQRVETMIPPSLPVSLYNILHATYMTDKCGTLASKRGRKPRADVDDNDSPKATPKKRGPAGKSPQLRRSKHNH